MACFLPGSERHWVSFLHFPSPAFSRARIPIRGCAVLRFWQLPRCWSSQLLCWLVTSRLGERCAWIPWLRCDTSNSCWNPFQECLLLSVRGDDFSLGVVRLLLNCR